MSEIQVVQPIAASRDRLWAALTEPAHLANWQADSADGSLARRSLVLGWPALGVHMHLRVLEAEDKRNLTLKSGRSTVRFQIHDSALTLTHGGLDDVDEAEGVRASWQVSLGLLNHYVKTHFGVPRVTHWALETAATTAQEAQVFFSDQAALNSWLTSDGTGIGKVRGDYRLTLRWNETASGKVLVKTEGRDLAVTWAEQDDSVLVFRTLPAPMQPEHRILALLWSHWGCQGSDSTRCHQLEAALSGLKRILDKNRSA
jgi:uncharacterized protein YndB with AHSA1/START domain